MEQNQPNTSAQPIENPPAPPETAAASPVAESIPAPPPAMPPQGWAQPPYYPPQPGWGPYPPPPPGFFHRLFHDEGGTVCRALHAFAVVFFVLGCVTLVFGIVAGATAFSTAGTSLLVVLGCIVAAVMECAFGLLLIAVGKIIAMRWKK